MPQHRRTLTEGLARSHSREFEPVRDGYWYRADGAGAPIAVSAAERDMFVRRFGQVVVWHGAALALGLTAAWLLVKRLAPYAVPFERGLFMAPFCVAIALALYRSLRWNQRAPVRALADRAPAGAANPAARATGMSYTEIVITVAFIAFYGAMMFGRSDTIGTIVIACSIPFGITLAVRKLLRERDLTPEQVRSSRPPALRGGCLLFLGFALLELAVLAGVTVLGALVGAFAQTASGLSQGDVPIIVGGIIGFVFGMMAAARIDRSCRRMTGESVGALIDSLPYIP